MHEPNDDSSGLREEAGHSSASSSTMSAVERDLRERVKELGCLYAISRLAQQKDLSLDELVRDVAALLCESWQFPELAAARVELEGRSCATQGFKRTRWLQTRLVRAHGKPAGRVEICYLRQPPRREPTGSVFLQEETHLLQAVAENLGRIVEARRAEEHLQTLSRELLRAQEMERQRIARELHDDVAQSLSMLKIGLESLECNGDGVESEHRQQVQELSTHVAGIIDSVRSLSYALLPPGLVQLGLVSTLFRFCEEFSSRTGIPVDFRAEGMDGLKVDFDFQINIYRIVQEALANVRRHAQASRVGVKLIASYPSVLLRVEDDGQGFPPEPIHGEGLRERHMGLWSMGERARLLGGVLRIRTAPGKGTRILVDIPHWRQG
ncbi:sensor histidine kinase [Oceanidesulfovibrio indonesiensis]|uniref:Sensor histidine kinase n=1 Tax=Oceanidesulfovibrio indonesiensis TaxID=54767 RepID=A0A7M3MGA8_9BACT|nr:sensor histidine kinase [Oceanidesulfovibrio indonesiensis]TVM18356.1 sensor histidine kinase [Oceanidesulfovibrio indonesiensis]